MSMLARSSKTSSAPVTEMDSLCAGRSQHDPAALTERFCEMMVSGALAQGGAAASNPAAARTPWDA